jgi:hypothetical protein
VEERFALSAIVQWERLRKSSFGPRVDEKREIVGLVGHRLHRDHGMGVA